MPPPASKRKTKVEALAGERDELARKNAELTERLREMEELLAQRTRASQEASEELRQFAYSVSHDLQEPLRSVTSYVQLLGRSIPPTEEAAEFVQFIVEGSARMNALIRDLLSYSRLSDSPRLTAVSLPNIVQGASFFLQGQLQEAGATLDAGELPEISGDESQLNQLVTELFRNAIKFRRPIPLTIQVSAESEGGETVVSVRDNGQGIDPKYCEQVFGVFKRLHGREVPGTGIGLALCRKIVRAHGGRIWIESDGASGTTIRFALPA